VWDVRIVDEQDRPVCISRCPIAIVPRQMGCAATIRQEGAK
jgi:acyl-coenzyme A thioesterase PaaI-like protein